MIVEDPLKAGIEMSDGEAGLHLRSSFSEEPQAGAVFGRGRIVPIVRGRARSKCRTE